MSQSSTRIVPEVGRSSVPSSVSKVLFPEPDGPTMKAQAPLGISKETPRSAFTWFSPRGSPWSRPELRSWPRGSGVRRDSVCTLADRFHGRQPRGSPGRVEAAEHAHHQGQGHSQGEVSRRLLELQTAAQEQVGNPDARDGQDTAQQPREQARDSCSPPARAGGHSSASSHSCEGSRIRRTAPAYS